MKSSPYIVGPAYDWVFFLSPPLVALAVGRPAAACDPEANLHDLGVDSIAAIRLIQGIEEKLGAAISPLEVFEHPRIADLAGCKRRRIHGRASEAPAYS